MPDNHDSSSSPASPRTESASNTDTTDELSFSVDARGAGVRVDAFLAQTAPGLSRARAQKMSEAGLVRVNGRRVRKGHLVVENDVVTLAEAAWIAQFSAAPDASATLAIAFEDAHVVVVVKPRGMPSHPLRKDELGTVANALVSRYPEMKDVGYSAREPGVLHRLDNDTSGLMIAARSKKAFETLREELAAGRIQKDYIGLAEGDVRAPRTISIPLCPHPRDSKKMLACVEEADAIRYDAESTETEITKSTTLAASSLVSLHAPTAKRHQLRAHLAAIGHPLVGDLLYGGPAREGLTGHLLHASRVRFEHPMTRQPVEVTNEDHGFERFA